MQDALLPFYFVEGHPVILLSYVSLFGVRSSSDLQREAHIPALLAFSIFDSLIILYVPIFRL